MTYGKANANSKANVSAVDDGTVAVNTSDYSAFCKNLRDALATIVGDNMVTFAEFGYKSFNAMTMFKTIQGIWQSKKIVEDEQRSDIVKCIALFYIRGPNVNHMTKNNSHNIDTIQSLRNRYGIKSKSEKNPDAITLPRIILVIPDCSYMVMKQEIPINSVVTGADIGLPSLNQLLTCPVIGSILNSKYLAGRNDLNHFIFVYTLLQAALTKKVSKGNNTIFGSYVDARNFVNIAMNNSIIDGDSAEVSAMQREISTLAEAISIADSLTAIKFIAAMDNETKACSVQDTLLTASINLCVKAKEAGKLDLINLTHYQNKTVTEINSETFSKTASE